MGEFGTKVENREAWNKRWDQRTEIETRNRDEINHEMATRGVALTTFYFYYLYDFFNTSKISWQQQYLKEMMKSIILI